MSSEVVVRVKVTAEDIEHGEAGACRRCPVSLAANRATCRDDSHASDIRLLFLGDDLFRWFRLPGRVIYFIREYDYHKGETIRHKFTPFAFDLTLPAELVLKGGETCNP